MAYIESIKVHISETYGKVINLFEKHKKTKEIKIKQLKENKDKWRKKQKKRDKERKKIREEKYTYTPPITHKDIYYIYKKEIDEIDEMYKNSYPTYFPYNYASSISSDNTDTTPVSDLNKTLYDLKNFINNIIIRIKEVLSSCDDIVNSCKTMTDITKNETVSMCCEEISDVSLSLQKIIDIPELNHNLLLLTELVLFINKIQEDFINDGSLDGSAYDSDQVNDYIDEKLVKALGLLKKKIKEIEYV